MKYLYLAFMVFNGYQFIQSGNPMSFALAILMGYFYVKESRVA